MKKLEMADTKEGLELRRMVREAAQKAPQWVQDQFNHDEAPPVTAERTYTPNELAEAQREAYWRGALDAHAYGDYNWPLNPLLWRQYALAKYPDQRVTGPSGTLYRLADHCLESSYGHPNSRWDPVRSVPIEDIPTVARLLDQQTKEEK